MNRDSITELWERLHDTMTLRFTASSRAEHLPLVSSSVSSSLTDHSPQMGSTPHLGTGWHGSGAGIVDVCDATPSTLIFKEVGLWRQNGGRELRFTNVFRWSRIENRVRLDHLRWGITRPVFLFEMTPDAEGVWRATTPHPCRADSYRATLRLDGVQVCVHWRINGPRKDEVIDYVYL